LKPIDFSAFSPELHFNTILFEMGGHLTPSSAGRMAALAGAKRLVLTHFYPECLGTDIADQCRKTYDGKLILARDLLAISF